MKQAEGRRQKAGDYMRNILACLERESGIRRKQRVIRKPGAVCAAWRAVFFIFCLLPTAYCLLPLTAAEAFEFQNVVIDHIDTYTIKVHWTTSEPASGQLMWGPTPAEATNVMLVFMKQRRQEMYIGGLEEGEEYVARIRAQHAGGQTHSDFYRFKTKGIPKPKFNQVLVQHKTSQGANVAWTTNIPVRSVFECGLDTSYGILAEPPQFSDQHQADVRRFAPKTEVFYRITIEDYRGWKNVTTGKFKTLDLNIALGKKVTGTFRNNPDPGWIKDSTYMPYLDRLTDGVADYFKSMATSGDPRLEDQWLQLDLDGIKEVQTIVTQWRGTCYPSEFRLRGSLDELNWYDFGVHDAATGEDDRSATGDPMLTHYAHIPKHLVRFIRIEIPKGSKYYRYFDFYNFVQLFEVKVWPPDPVKKMW